MLKKECSRGGAHKGVLMRGGQETVLKRVSKQASSQALRRPSVGAMPRRGLFSCTEAALAVLTMLIGILQCFLKAICVITIIGYFKIDNTVLK